MKPEGSRSRWILWSALAVTALYGVFVLLLWQMGVLPFDPDARGSEAFAAVLGLMGGFFASSLTFVGVVLKHSLDERNAKLAEETEKRLELEGKRNEQLKRDEERRLGLEASIKAVDLLGSPTGDASPLKQAGALFALAHLGELELALTLLTAVWPSGTLSPHAAAALTNKGLVSRDPRLQLDAAGGFAANAPLLLLSEGGVEWPSCVDGEWPGAMPLQARQDILFGFAKALFSRPLSEWNAGYLNGVLVQMDIIRRTDESRFVAGGAILLMRLLFQIPDMASGELYLDAGPLQLEPLSQEIQELADDAESVATSEIVDVLSRYGPAWLNSGPVGKALVSDGKLSGAPTPDRSIPSDVPPTAGKGRC